MGDLAAGINLSNVPSTSRAHKPTHPRNGCRLLGVAIPKAANAAAIAGILDLHVNAIGIFEIQLFGVAALPDDGLYAESSQLGKHGLCLEALDREADMMNTRTSSKFGGWIQPDEPLTSAQVYVSALTRQDWHAKEFLIERLRPGDIGYEEGCMIQLSCCTDGWLLLPRRKQLRAFIWSG